MSKLSDKKREELLNRCGWLIVFLARLDVIDNYEQWHEMRKVYYKLG